MPDYSGHPTHEEYITGLWLRLRCLTQSVLDDSIGIVEGTLQIEPILYELNLSNEADLQEIIGLGSECEYMVFGEEAKLKPFEALEQQRHLSACEEANRGSIKSACRAILHLYFQNDKNSQT